ncbi:MAG: AEC family transporter [Pseudomonadota bacterium]|nr:AEC family transporter [Pseudomonadota bacterium]
MIDVFSATVPIFLIVAVGYVVTRLGVLKRADMTVLSTFVVKVALPALVFVSVAGRSLGEILNPTWLLTYGVSAMIMMGLGNLYAKARGRSAARAATVGFAMSGTNNGFVGLPMFLILLPNVAGLAAGMAMLVDNTLIIPVALAMYEAITGAGGPLTHKLGVLVRRVLLHPMVIAIILALLLGALNLELTGMLDRAVQMVASSSSAVALFSIGGMLVGLQVRGQIADILTAVGGKLLLMPLLAVGLVNLLPTLALPTLSTDLRVAAVLTCALPSMTVMAAVAEQHGEGDLGAASMMLSTVISFFTLTAWMMGLRAVGWL